MQVKLNQVFYIPLPVLDEHGSRSQHIAFLASEPDQFVRLKPALSQTTQICQKRLVMGDEFARLMALENTPYAGELPAPLSDTGLSDHEVWRWLDEVSVRCKTVSVNELQCVLGNKQVMLKAILGGGYGFVYRLTVDEQDYALKLFYQPDPENRFHGSYAELASGLYMTGQNVEDVSLSYGGNPKAGWLLDQWIGPDTPHRSTGITFLSILKGLGRRYNDDKDDGANRLYHHWWTDRGGIGS